MANDSIRVAVTGGAGSGKSAVCEMLKRFGLTVYDADRFARDAVEVGTSGYRMIVERFGRRVLQEDGGLNRRLLREIMTGDPEAKEALEEILHPEIIRMMCEKLKDARRNGESLVMEVPLLFELGLEKMFDTVVTVFSGEQSRIRRLTRRDDLDQARAKALVGLQMPETEKARRADFVLRNVGSMENLEKDVKKMYFRLFKPSSSDKSS